MSAIWGRRRSTGSRLLVRSEATFPQPEDLAYRTGLSVTALEGLAASGALEVLGVERREGLWAAGALAEIDPERLPLSPGIEAPQLGLMDSEEDHRADSVVDRASPQPIRSSSSAHS